MLSAKEKLILESLEPTAAEHGIEIVTVEITGARKAPTIRVYIDCEGGIGFDELSGSQVWVDAIVEEIDPFPGAYTLEVTSPGIDRPLRTKEHFERFAGERAFISLTAPLNGRGKYTGRLDGVEGDEVLITVEDGTFYRLPFESIKKAHVIATINFGS